MANMFSHKSEKQIPKTLGECTHPDATASNLHLWAERLEKWGKTLFWILIVYGIINAIIMSIVVEEVVGYYRNWTETSFDFIMFFTSIVETGLYAFLEYCAYHVLALLISSLALITQNTIISANVVLYNASKNEPICETAQETACVTTTPNDKKDNITTPIQAVNSFTTPEFWVCKACGTNNSKNYGQCKKCGQHRSQ